MNRELPVDVAIVGAGGAGLSLVLALERAARAAGSTPPSIAVIDPVQRQATDRTWCWWTRPPSGPGSDLLPLAHRTWSRMELRDRSGRAREYDLGDLRYVMLRSGDFYAEAEAALGRLGERGHRITATVEQIGDGEDGVELLGDGLHLRARWVFDSRPAAPVRPGATRLLQHFRGWTVRFDRPVLDPRLPTLMDFRPVQPGRGVAFGYCLPLDEQRALVEYTEFSRQRLAPAEYDRALAGYLTDRWGVGYTIEEQEDGVIPMTDAPFARRVGASVFRLGTAGGATRPSTGYTFAAIQRQAAAVAGLLIEGRTPLPPRPYPARHLWLDAVLLRALDRGYVRGPELFTGLFEANPSERVVRFLDGESSLVDELAIMRSSPMTPMLRATVEDAAGRVRRRLWPGRASTKW